MARPALVAGATGLVGGFCLAELLENRDFDPVYALVRRPLPERPKLHQITTDFDSLRELPPLAGGAVFCALGTTIRKAGTQEAFRKVDYDYSLRLAQLARTSGAETFVLVSSIGANARSNNFYLR